MNTPTTIYVAQASYTCFLAAMVLIHLTVCAVLTPTTPRHRTTAAAARRGRK